jgi:hypothetical protein
VRRATVLLRSPAFDDDIARINIDPHRDALFVRRRLVYLGDRCKTSQSLPVGRAVLLGRRDRARYSPIVVPSHGLAVFGTAATQHVNIRLPEFFEHWLQPVLVTTDMHHIHHPIGFSRANCNYGAAL